MNTLAHLTLNTGHLRMSPRSEVRDETIRVLDPAVRGGKHTVQGMQIEVNRHKNGASFGIGIGGHTMILGAVIWNEATAETTWESMVDAYRVQHGEEPPAKMPADAPWLAVMLPCSNATMLSIATTDQLLQLGDLERCIAWTILAQEGLSDL